MEEFWEMTLVRLVVEFLVMFLALSLERFVGVFSVKTLVNSVEQLFQMSVVGSLGRTLG